MGKTIEKVINLRGWDVKLDINHLSSTFSVEVEEGHEIEAPSIEDLSLKIDAWLKREKAKERRKNKGKIDIPILRFTNDSDEIRAAREGGHYRRTGGLPPRIPRSSDEPTPWTLIPCRITGIHSHTGKVIVKRGIARAVQEGRDYNKFLKPMADEEQEEFLRLHAEATASNQAFNEFKGKFEIAHLKEHLEEKGITE